MKIKSLALFAVFGLLFTSPFLSAQVLVGPLPPLIGPKNESQVAAVVNVLLGTPGTYSTAVDAWSRWVLSGNPMAPAPAQNIIPADLSVALNKYYVTSQPLSDAEWDLVNTFERYAAYVNYPPLNVYGFFGTGDIPDLDTFLSMSDDEDAAADDSINYIALSTYQALGNQVEY